MCKNTLHGFHIKGLCIECKMPITCRLPQVSHFLHCKTFFFPFSPVFGVIMRYLSLIKVISAFFQGSMHKFHRTMQTEERRQALDG